MTASYQCKKCGLIFVVGWLHFHNGKRTNKPQSITFIVCVECGCNYYVLHDNNVVNESIYVTGISIDENIDITNVLKCVLEKKAEKINLAFPLTLNNLSPISSKQHNDNLTVRLLQRIFGIKSERLHKSYNFGMIKCLNCNQEKRLMAKYPFETLCPNCMDNTLDSFSFIT